MTWQLQRQLAWVVAALAVPVGGALAAEEGAGTRYDFAGDFRLRWESVQLEDAADNNRARYRARFDMNVAFADDIDLVFRLATNSGSPVSNNLDFGDGFTTREVRLDRAYADWRIDDAWTLRGGRMKQPWLRAGGTQFIWDSDLSPEGIAALYDTDALFGSVSVLTVENRSAADDTLLIAGQGGYRWSPRDADSLKLGASLYQYTNVEGNAPFPGGGQGNSLDAAGNYATGFRIVELFAEYRTRVSDWPLVAYASVAQNMDASGEDGAWSAGASLGGQATGDLRAGYRWQGTEADAVVGAYIHSDFANGATGSSGHTINLQYLLRDNIQLGATLMLSEFGAAGSERDFDRLMLDVQFTFD